MSNVDNIKYSNLTFTHTEDDIYSIQATFQLYGGLLVAGYSQPVYNVFQVTFNDSGSETLSGDITFSSQLDNPPANPDWQNAVDFNFLDLVSGLSSDKKGKIKVKGNYCPPPGTPVNQGSTPGVLAGYGARIKTVNISLGSGISQVTVTTENISGAGAGYRIVSNTQHSISTGSGPVEVWAFEIQDGGTVDTNNSFQFDFSSIDPDVGLPILFYPSGTSIDDIDQSDALLWVEQ